MRNVREVKYCRICNSTDLYSFLNLGNQPIPNGFLTKDELSQDEKKYPLVVAYCRSCSLTQVKYVVDAEVMFKNYLYIPSASQTRLDNFRQLAQDVKKRTTLDSTSLIVDIGSNDGSLLTVFKNLGMRVMGIDPAENLVKIAELNGIPTTLGYFDTKLAARVVQKQGKATVAFATNVFAHIDDIHEFLNGVALLLDDDGIFVSQFPYVLDLLRENQFDTIYHEHLSYFSVKSLINLASQSDVEIFDIESSSLDGGSLKVFWKLRKCPKYQVQQTTIEKYLRNEEKQGIYSDNTYVEFAKRVKRLKNDSKKKLLALKKAGKKLIGYGAAAKGNILLNYFDISPRLFDYIVDSTLYKQGRYTPGKHIPIFSEAKILETKPDYIVILAWNFKNEIIKKNSLVKKYGGKFMVCVPKVEIFE